MGNPRSAGNAWAKIRNKLMTPNDGSAPVTAAPKKAGGARKKAVKNEGDEDDEDAVPKTPRKRAAKKQDVDGEGSPKKKPGRPKKAAAAKEKCEFVLCGGIVLDVC